MHTLDPYLTRLYSARAVPTVTAAGTAPPRRLPRRFPDSFCLWTPPPRFRAPVAFLTANWDSTLRPDVSGWICFYS